MKVLNRKVLALNKFWKPIRIVTVKQALIMIFSKKEAEIIDPILYTKYVWDEWIELEIKDEEVLHSSHEVYKIPEVILLPHCAKNCFAFKPRVSKNNIFKRDGFQCQFCGIKPEKKMLSIEHLTPKSRGGLTTFLNCTTACMQCNLRKGDRLLKETNLKLLNEPYEPKLSFFQVDIVNDNWRVFMKDIYS